MNVVILKGNLTRGVELKHGQYGAIAGFGLAMNRRTKNGTETTFVECEAWGKTAENISKYFNKGKPILVEGRLKLNAWTGQDGQKKSTLRVTVNNFEFVGGTQATGDQPAGNDEPF
jgi:single-strand DNA-binding protein